MANPYPSTTFIFDTNPLRGASNSLIAYGWNNWEFSLNVGLAKNLFKLQPGIIYKINQETNINTFLSISRRKVMLGTTLNYSLDAATKIYMQVKGGFQFDKHGYYWLSGMKFGLSYHGLSLSLPIMLGSHNPTSNSYSVLFTALTMLAGALGFTWYIQHDRKTKK